MLQADGDFDLEHGFGRGDGSDVYRAFFAPTLDGATTPDTDAYQGGTILANGNRLHAIGAPGAVMSFQHSNAAAPTITTASLPRAHTDRHYSVALAHTGGSSPFTWSEYLEAPSYTLSDLGPQAFALGGTAQGFNADEETWSVDLPFLFPYYDTCYARVFVNPNGCVDLAPLENEYYDTAGALRALPRIAGLWDNLATDTAGGQDLYVDDSVPGAVRFRWNAETVDTGMPANFAITLHADGRIRFDYGAGNTELSPTVGISRGQAADLVLVASHTDQATLTDASSLEFTLHGSALPPGLSLSPAGVLSGTPTVPGSYTFQVRVRDSGNRYAQRELTLKVATKLFPSESP
jgi:hypothetical protein